MASIVMAVLDPSDDTPGQFNYPVPPYLNVFRPLCTPAHNWVSVNSGNGGGHILANDPGCENNVLASITRSNPGPYLVLTTCRWQEWWLLNMEVVHDLDVVDDDDDGWHAEQAVRDVRWSGWVGSDQRPRWWTDRQIAEATKRKYRQRQITTSCCRSDVDIGWTIKQKYHNINQSIEELDMTWSQC